jgi:hypothetical protein
MSERAESAIERVLKCVASVVPLQTHLCVFSLHSRLTERLSVEQPPDVSTAKRLSELEPVVTAVGTLRAKEEELRVSDWA